MSPQMTPTSTFVERGPTARRMRPTVAGAAGPGGTLRRAADPIDGVPMTQTLQHVLDGGAPVDALMTIEPDERDALLALLTIHELWLAPISHLQGRERYQNHPAVAALKWRLEEAFIERLDRRCPPADVTHLDATAAMRRIAASGLVPPVYDWVGASATWGELVEFLALEGGPDADFDDLVAMAQVGISGDAKVALGANYWDEMGRGELAAVHTVLHDDLVRAIAMPSIPRDELPTSALERKAIGGLLVTNRHLQPEAIGALGLLEMQAGPRCRAVVKALKRLDAPAGAFPFYEEHAHADPRHGKEWLDRVVAPLSEDPRWAEGIVRGARWRQEINRRFFADALDLFAGHQHQREATTALRRIA